MWWSGPVQQRSVNRVRAGRQQLSTETACVPQIAWPPLSRTGTDRTCAMSQPTTSPAAHEGSDLPAKLAPPRLVTPAPEPELEPPTQPAPASPSVFDHMNDLADEHEVDRGARATALAGSAPRSVAPERAAVTAESFVPRRMIMQVDMAGRIVEVDWATTAALGWPTEELVGSSIFDWIHPSEIEESRRSWNELVAAPGSGRRLKTRFWHRDGRWLWVEQTDRNLLDDVAETVISELVDITPEIEAQHALDARNRILAVLSESPNTGIIEITPERQVAFVNREWFAAADLADGAPFVAFLATLVDGERVQRALTNACTKGLETRFVAARIDGSEVEIRVQSLPTTAGVRNGVVALDPITRDPGSPRAAAVVAPHEQPVRPPTMVAPPAPAPLVAPARVAPAVPAQPTPVVAPSPSPSPAPAPAPNLPAIRLPVPALIPPDERLRQRARERGLAREAAIALTEQRPMPIVLGPSSIEYSESTELAVIADEEPKPDTGRLRGWAGFALPELLVVVGIGVAALFVRLWQLSTVPAGLHVEEGLAALAAQQVADGVSAGLWDTNQPTVHIYAAAPAIAAFGQSIFAVRIMSALIGALTVGALFVVARPRFGRRVAIAAAAVLALLTWHVHYSRLAFGAIWWPLVGLAAAALTVRALQTRSKAGLVAAGVMTGLGVYVAFEHWVFLFAVTAFVIGWLLSTVRDRPIAATLVDIALFVVAATITVAGMGRYLGAFPSWSELTNFNNTLTARFDDGLGIIAPVPLVILAAAAVGVLVAAFRAVREPREHNPLLLLSLVLIASYALAVAVVGSEAGYRQAFVLAPFVALLAGTGFAWTFQFLARHIGRIGAWSFATLIGLVFALTTVPSYFGDFSGDSKQRELFTADYVQVADIVNAAEGDPLVEVILGDGATEPVTPQLTFLTDGKVGADGLPGDSSNEAGRPRLFIILGQDAPQLATLESLYPTGAVTTEGVGDSGRYVAYFVPSAAGGGGQ